MNTKKVKLGKYATVMGAVNREPIQDSFRAKGGLIRWGELVRKVRENPELVGEGELLIAGGSPVTLYGHTGWGFIARESDGSLRMGSAPFDKNREPGETSWWKSRYNSFMVFVEEESEVPLYGDPLEENTAALSESS